MPRQAGQNRDSQNDLIVGPPPGAGVHQFVHDGETNAAAHFPLAGRTAPARLRAVEGDGKLFGRLSGLRVDLEGLALRVVEGEELFYRITVENTTGDELREVRLMEAWFTDGPPITSELRSLELPPLAPGTRYLVPRQASFQAGVTSLVAAVSACGPAPGVFLASDRRKRLVIRCDTEPKHRYLPAA